MFRITKIIYAFESILIIEIINIKGMKMKQIINLFCFCLLCTISYTQDLGPSEIYRLNFIKFKHGTQSKATKIGVDLYSKALNQSNTGHLVLKAETGPWDLLVIVPMDPNHSYQVLHQNEFFANMESIAGSKSALDKMNQEYDSYVLDDVMYYYRGKTDYALDNSQHYRSRHIKCAAGTIGEAMKGGMKHLNGSLEKLGTKNLALQVISGVDDIIIIEPMEKENIFSNTPEYNKKWGEALRTTGSPEEISAFFNRWNEIIQREDLHYFTKL